MNNDNDPASVAELQQENLRLRRSLRKCQSLVEECRTKLLAKDDPSFMIPPAEKKG